MGCDLVIFHVKQIGQFSFELETCVMFTISFDALVMCIISGMVCKTRSWEAKVSLILTMLKEVEIVVSGLMKDALI